MKTSSYTLKSEHFSAPVDIDADDSPQTLVTVFAQRCVDATLFDYLKNRYPNSVVIGCSTSGQIINQDIVDEEVVVGVCRFEKTTLKIGSEKVSSSDDSYLAGKKLAQSLNDQELRAIFLLSDGLLVNGSELISGINSEVSNDVSVTGGLAGDADKFESTWVLNNSVADSGAIVGVGFYGDAIKIAHGSQGGWDKFGVERTATKSEHNVLYTIDDRPALELYKEYLGDRAEGLPSTGLLFPLFVKIQNDQELVEKQVVRTILAVSEEDNSLTFAGDIPIGSKIQLMRANFDRLVDGAADAAE
ncbi:MAG: hypothetical protein HN826_10480, partial [Methylococcales bacterium]|nr:hypothetical protein [Methylococcales bacterium]